MRYCENSNKLQKIKIAKIARMLRITADQLYADYKIQDDGDRLWYIVNCHCATIHVLSFIFVAIGWYTGYGIQKVDSLLNNLTVLTFNTQVNRNGTEFSKHMLHGINE